MAAAAGQAGNAIVTFGGQVLGSLGQSIKMTQNKVSTLSQRLHRTAVDTGTGIAARASKAFGAVGVAVAGAFAVGSIVRFGAAAAEMAMEFEAMMTQAFLRVGDISQEMKDNLTDLARTLGRTTQYSAQEAAEAMKNLAAAGLDANEIIIATPHILALAAANAIDLSEASTIATTSLASLGLETTDTTRLVDVFTNQAQRSNATVTGLGDAMSYAGSAMNQAHQSMETAVALMGGLNDAGLQGSRAGVGLAAMMRDLAEHAENGRIQTESMNVALYDANGNWRDAIDIIADMAVATEHMTDKQRDQELGTILQAQGMRAFNSLLSIGTQKLREHKKANQEAAGTAEQAAEEMANTWKGKTKAMASAWEGLKEAVGSTFKPINELVLELATTALNAITDVVLGISEGLENMNHRILEFFNNTKLILTGRFSELGKKAGSDMTDNLKQSMDDSKGAIVNSGVVMAKSLSHQIEKESKIGAQKMAQAWHDTVIPAWVKMTDKVVAILPPSVSKAIGQMNQSMLESYGKLTTTLGGLLSKAGEKMGLDMSGNLMQSINTSNKKIVESGRVMVVNLSRWVEKESKIGAQKMAQAWHGTVIPAWNDMTTQMVVMAKKAGNIIGNAFFRLGVAGKFIKLMVASLGLALFRVIGPVNAVKLALGALKTGIITLRFFTAVFEKALAGLFVVFSSLAKMVQTLARGLGWLGQNIVKLMNAIPATSNVVSAASVQFERLNIAIRRATSATATAKMAWGSMVPLLTLFMGESGMWIAAIWAFASSFDALTRKQVINFILTKLWRGALWLALAPIKLLGIALKVASGAMGADAAMKMLSIRVTKAWMALQGLAAIAQKKLIWAMARGIGVENTRILLNAKSIALDKIKVAWTWLRVKAIGALAAAIIQGAVVQSWATRVLATSTVASTAHTWVTRALTWANVHALAPLRAWIASMWAKIAVTKVGIGVMALAKFATLALNAAFLASPIGWIVGGIAAIILVVGSLAGKFGALGKVIAAPFKLLWNILKVILAPLGWVLKGLGVIFGFGGRKAPELSFAGAGSGGGGGGSFGESPALSQSSMPQLFGGGSKRGNFNFNVQNSFNIGEHENEAVRKEVQRAMEAAIRQAEHTYRTQEG